MFIRKFADATRAQTAGALLALLLVACGRPAAPDAVPAAEPARETPGSPDSTPDTPPAEMPGSPAQPAPEAPPPQEPSAAPKPASLSAPAVTSMSVASATAKLGVPVELRYQLDGPVLANQPVMLHLAAIPHTAGANLTVSVKPVAGLRVDAPALTVQKANADGVYRQRLSLTALESAPTGLSVMVTMEMGQGTAFGFFTVPLESGTVAQKQKSVKQR